MALVTGLPNFFSTAKPAATDFDAAHDAIATQVGGVSWNGSAYARHPGNLDANNIVAAAGFRNSQKAEPFSIVAFSSPLNTVYPIPVDAFLFAVASAAQGLAKALSFYVNGALMQIVNMPATIGSSVQCWTALSVSVHAGDWLFVDGLAFPAGGLVLLGKARHLP